jgi:hypothetical protein
MVVKALIQNVATDAELTALTGMSKNTFVYHTVNDKIYTYEPKFGIGYVSSIDGGYWVEDSIEGIDLNTYKDFRFEEIDVRTEEKIKLGFSYAGKIFSMSANAQTNILALDNTRDDPAMSYPVGYSTLDDSEHYDVVDATDLHNMYLTALATKKAWVDSGTVLKDAVRAAIDENAVSLIIDNR